MILSENMSHLYYKPKKTRLHRSELAVPGSSPQMFEKALNSNADYIFLDLEDAVSPNDKVTAKKILLKLWVTWIGEKRAKQFPSELIVLIRITCIET